MQLRKVHGGCAITRSQESPSSANASPWTWGREAPTAAGRRRPHHDRAPERLAHDAGPLARQPGPSPATPCPALVAAINPQTGPALRPAPPPQSSAKPSIH